MKRSLIDALVVAGISGILCAHAVSPSVASEAVFRHTMGVALELTGDSGSVAPVAETDRTSEFDSQACGSGYSGLENRTRDAISWSDGSTTYGEWSEWDDTSCVALVPPVWETSVDLPGGTVNELYSHTLVATDDDGDVTYSIVGEAPAWLGLIDTTGAISGTPSEEGPISVTVRATDATNAYVDRTFTIQIAAPEPDACETGPVGTACRDGAIYAGLSLSMFGSGEGHRIYAASADESGTYTWNNGTAPTTHTGATSVSDGLANTNLLVGLSDTGAPYLAAKICRARGPEWYLPAIEELAALNRNRDAIGGFSINGGFYWASSEFPDQQFLYTAYNMEFSGNPNYDGGTSDSIHKDSARLVRCVRG